MSAAEVMAVTSDLQDVSGRIVWFRASGPIPIPTLQAAWAAHGLNANLLPNGRSREAAAKKALEDIAMGMRMLVRPLGRRGKDGYILKHEHVIGSSELDYSTELKVKVIGGSLDIEPSYDYRAVTLHQKFAQHIGELANERIGVWVWRSLAPTCDAVGLSGGGGGFYFIPRGFVPLWDAYVNVIHEVAEGVRFFAIPAMQGPEAIEAVLESIKAEAESATRLMNEELAKTGDEALGKRALEQRLARTAAVREKIARYENLLGAGLPEVHSRLDDLKMAVTTAILVASATPEDAA